MLSVIILAGGIGSRLKTGSSKVLVEFAGKSMLRRVCEAALKLNAENYIIVVPEEHEGHVNECPIPNVTWAVQKHANGTGDAVKIATQHLSSIQHKVLILCADVPLISENDLERLIQGDNLELLTALPQDPGSMGRIKRDLNGMVTGIVEASDACANDLEINEVFSGIMQTPSELLLKFLPTLDTNNNQGEFYLTDIVRYARKNNYIVNANLAQPWWSVQGVNNLEELAALERRFYVQIAKKLQNKGVRILDHKRFDCRAEIICGINTTIDINVIFKGEVTIGNGCYIGPNVIIENSIIGDNVTIMANSVILNSVISESTTVGPFAHIRPESNIDSNCRIGSFVEIKASTIGSHSKVPHLSYIGNAKIGSKVNIGAGVITCNFNGKVKYESIIQDNCFIGAGVQLVAPIEIGRNSVVGAGTCLRQNVVSETLAYNKPETIIKKDWAGLKRFKEKTT